jgi:hypothetical protein
MTDYLIHFNKNHSKKNGQFTSGDGDGDGIVNDHANQKKPASKEARSLYKYMKKKSWRVRDDDIREKLKRNKSFQEIAKDEELQKSFKKFRGAGYDTPDVWKNESVIKNARRDFKKFKGYEYDANKANYQDDKLFERMVYGESETNKSYQNSLKKSNREILSKQYDQERQRVVKDFCKELYDQPIIGSYIKYGSEVNNLINSIMYEQYT